MAFKRQNSFENLNPFKIQKKNTQWFNGLIEATKDPKNIIREDELVVTIKDMYPKAKFHYLILPKENINSLKSVTTIHKKLLIHMLDVGKKLAAGNEHENVKFKIGYHSQASMARLHLHVISEDMNSDRLKSKKHWNSFTTDFFLNAEDVNKQLEKDGKIVLPSSETCKKLLNTPLKCHKCEFTANSMPKLKHHIAEHTYLN